MALFSLPPQQTALPTDATPFHHVPIQRRTMVAEWAPQSGIQLTWPHAETDWAYMLEEVTECYLHLAYEIAVRQPLLIVCPQPEAVRALIEQRLPQRAMQHIRYATCPTNDTWARDHAFLSVVGPDGVELLDFRFNGWGGKFEASLDNAINQRLHAEGHLHGSYVDCLDFELEGGSIESDSNGTLLTTAYCLLNPNRNPAYNRQQIEEKLCCLLGAERILWLEHGALAGDDTDSHIDTLARLAPDDTIVYTAPPADSTDSHYAELQIMEAELKAFRTAQGKPYRLVALPLPAAIYDEEGERLPATYANYLVMNHAVLCPTYGQPVLDAQALEAIGHAFPGREVVGIDCRALIRQHGSLHCATMQYPLGVFPQ